MKFINVGFKNTVNTERLIGISSPVSSGIKRTINAAKERGMLVDMTEGKRTGAVLVMESGHVILSINAPETLKKRIE